MNISWWNLAKVGYLCRSFTVQWNKFLCQYNSLTISLQNRNSSWVQSQHPPTQWHLMGDRWNSVENQAKMAVNKSTETRHPLKCTKHKFYSPSLVFRPFPSFLLEPFEQLHNDDTHAVVRPVLYSLAEQISLWPGHFPVHYYCLLLQEVAWQ